MSVREAAPSRSPGSGSSTRCSTWSAKGGPTIWSSPRSAAAAASRWRRSTATSRPRTRCSTRRPRNRRASAAGVPVGDEIGDPVAVPAHDVALVRRQPAAGASPGHVGGRARDAQPPVRRIACAGSRTSSRTAASTRRRPRAQRLVRLALLLTSSLAFLDLHDRQGLEPDAAADDVEWAVAAL